MLVVPLLDRVTYPLTGVTISSQVLALDGWVVAPVRVDSPSSRHRCWPCSGWSGGRGAADCQTVWNGLASALLQDVGFGLKLTPRMEYTATGFAQPIKQVFETIYQPT